MTTTAAYMVKVGLNHTIELPHEVPVGATVAVIVVPNEQAEDARHARFAATLEAIRKAAAQPALPISDAELDARIERARKTRA